MRESSPKARTKGDVPEPISPELALVDPVLRSVAIAELPAPESFAFPRLRPTSAAAAGAAEPAEDPAARQAATSHHVSLPVAAAAYAITAIVRAALFDLSVVLALVVLIAMLNLLR
jgi:hypothetical protein